MSWDVHTATGPMFDASMTLEEIPTFPVEFMDDDRERAELIQRIRRLIRRMEGRQKYMQELAEAERPL